MLKSRGESARMLGANGRRYMLEEMQTGMVVSMVVWDLVQETLKVKGF